MNTRDKTVLKRSASTNELTGPSTALTLREAKSYSGTTMANLKFNDCNQNNHFQDNQENCLELLCKECETQETEKSGIPTKDAFTQEIYYVNEELLNHNGTTYSGKDIAWTWKKDFRMWLWKNHHDIKINRSVAEMKAPAII